jgi:DNA-binding PadR family transcriptional regulator
MQQERWAKKMAKYFGDIHENWHERHGHGHAHGHPHDHGHFDEGDFEAAGRGEGRGRRGGHRHGRGFFGGHGNPFGGNPFGGNPFGGNPFARRMRAKRGDVRSAILVLLAEQPRNGYQVMQELEQRSGGAWRPSPGSVYPAFQQLEDEGLIRADESGSGKVYHLTDAGKLAAQKINADGEAPWEALGDDDEEHMAMFHQIKQVGLACLQIAHAANPQQTKEATKVLSDARKALYAILAQDPEDAGEK